ncbi:MAG: D-tyrosyl-tRNA(Tyr) deacylase [Candidatus Omnitrophica bacterium]|nr:D-tyrosyl-tRNA(Tyr) deacylase [Candidatus Omnitrophota bacterium]
MRAVIQRVKEASVTIEGKVYDTIGPGLLVYLGLREGDTSEDASWMRKKIMMARVFGDEHGKMGRSVQDIQGEILLISQITLYGEMRKGNRPDMTVSMKPQEAKDFFEQFVKQLSEESKLPVKQGQFGASMEIHSTNDGPVTLILDSQMREMSRRS